MISTMPTALPGELPGDQAAPPLPQALPSPLPAGLPVAEDPQNRRGLTPREVEVLRHLTFGLSNRDIAAVLAISAETVKAHIQHLLPKLGVANRTQAAVWAVRQRVL